MRIGAALLALLLPAAVTGAQDAAAADPAALSAPDYAEELRRIEEALAAGRHEEAAARGESLRGRRVSDGAGTVPPDPAVLEAVIAARSGGSPRRAELAVRAVRRGLEAAGIEAGPGDAELLRRVQAAAPRPLTRGGEVGGLPVQPGVPERFLDGVGSWYRSAVEALERFLRRLWRLWPRRAQRAEEATPALSLGVALLVGVVAAGLAVLAMRALRRAAPAAPAVSAREASSRRDEDPLSREADEWEAYAAELSAAGRAREAIRAWYHAVLVALFRAGALHHHKGRTNWEYVSRVPPEAPWRPAFISITGLFDREWYGRDRSAPDTLRGCAAEARAILRQVRAEGT